MRKLLILKWFPCCRWSPVSLYDEERMKDKVALLLLLLL